MCVHHSISIISKVDIVFQKWREFKCSKHLKARDMQNLFLENFRLHFKVFYTRQVACARLNETVVSIIGGTFPLSKVYIRLKRLLSSYTWP